MMDFIPLKTQKMAQLSEEQFSKLKETFAESSGGTGTYGAYAVLFLMAVYVLLRKGLRNSLARQTLFAIILVIFVVCTANSVIYTKLFYMTMDDFQFSESHQVLIDRYLIVLSVFSHVNHQGQNIPLIVYVTSSVDCAFEVKDMPTKHAARSGLGTLWFYLTLLGTNIAATGLVGYKYWEYRTTKSTIADASMINQARGRPKVEKVLILIMESGFIYCFYWITVMLSAVRVTTDVGHEVLECVLPQIQGIYLTVVILLVAWQKDEVDSTVTPPIATRGISTINFAHSPNLGSTDSSDGIAGDSDERLPHIGQSFVERGDLVFPTDPTYASAISRWASNAERLAALVAFPKTTDDITLILEYALRFSTPALPIAVKCGGHSASGASSVSRGVVIDLSRYFGDVRVDPEAKLAYVGGGALWKTVDEKAIHQGLATVGGIVNHTGVGGLTLGGGFGFLTGEHGLTIDNLVRATITLTSGETLSISSQPDENPDLFWAIRGAGSNFGVISEFVFRLHPQREQVYSGMLVYNVEKVEEICRVANAWWNEDGKGKSGNGPSRKERLFINTAWNEETTLQVVPFYNGSEAEGREVFKAFLDLNPIQDLTTSVPYPELNAASNALFPHGRPYITTGYQAHVANPESIKKVVKLFRKYYEDDLKRERKVGLNVVVIHEYTPFSKVLSVPDTETPFPRRRVNNGFLIATWAENDEEMNKSAKEMVYEVKRVFREDEMLERGQEDDGSEFQPSSIEQDFRQSPTAKVEDLFGIKNYQRLQVLKKRYDPENVFCSWLAIGMDAD
ncbi:hypothetical protein D9758_011708 [Tetrapyrgos nigripes]|uniref:FAD-binding PCMH-type domain-containing protein n=1 Tax=Tetrapyrgos nigripes TaxID=182062 RepID=A0A8H5GD23_9AGAR|nr:hypothetical protein D9758_011708 [Tetrapyrgos nigripes]